MSAITEITLKVCNIFLPNKKALQQGRNLVILRGGRRYICNWKDEIIHGPSPSVKCVAPLIRDMFLAEV